jgi:hypothetical protein
VWGPMVHVVVQDPPRGPNDIRGVWSSSVKVWSHGSSPEHFHLKTRGNTGPVLERGAGLETNGPVRRVQTHRLGCSVP